MSVAQVLEAGCEALEERCKGERGEAPCSRAVLLLFLSRSIADKGERSRNPTTLRPDREVLLLMEA